MDYNHHDQPPTKKARLSAPASPAMSDNFSDPDDLYDTPVKAQALQKMEDAQNQPSQAAVQISSTGIPGLSFTTVPAQATAQSNTVSTITSTQPQSSSLETQSSTLDPQTQLGQSTETVNSTSAEPSVDPLQAGEHSDEAVYTSAMITTQIQPSLEISDEKIDQPVATSQPTLGLQDQIMHVENGSTDREPSLADFQMQLMLLEQEHKRRVLIAGQEEERAGIAGESLNNEFDDNSEPAQVAAGFAETNAQSVEILEIPAGRKVQGAPGSISAPPNAGDGSAEFEYDSSPLDGSDDSSDSSDDSSDNDGSEDDYELLDPAEMARILMQEGGEDDDDRPKGGKNNDQTRTKNEIPAVKVEKPNIEVTPGMVIKELGHVENIVENYVLVKGTLSGETQVLESGSVLCLESRKVIGAVDDLVGRVEEPRYSVAFTNGAEVAEYGVTHGTKIFYVVDHSSYVFTQPLRNLKGYDTSNVNDEEAGVEEMEFSDDEAEADYKRKLKQEKLARKGIVKQEPNAEMGQQAVSGSADIALKYDDDDDAEDLYKPLPRPVHYGSGTPSLEMLTPQARGRGRGRGGRDRGDRGRGRGGRGGRGNETRGRDGRGGFSQPDVATPEPTTQPGSHVKFPAQQHDRASSSGTANARPSPPKAQSAAAPLMNPSHQSSHPYHNPAPSSNNYGSQSQQPVPYGNQYPQFPTAQGYPQTAAQGYPQTAAQGYPQTYGYNQPQFPPPPPLGQYPMMPFQQPQPGFPMPPPGSFVNPNFYQQFANQQPPHQPQPPQNHQQQYRGNPNQQQQGWQNYQQQNYRQ